MKARFAALSPLLSALLWSAALVLAPGPLAPGSVLLVGLGLIGAAAVAVVGMILTGGRWASLLAAADASIALAVAVIRPIDLIWLVALAATAISVFVLLSGPVAVASRRLPPAPGLPSRAVLMPCLLIIFPAVLGLVAWDGPTLGTIVVGVSSPLAALWYARVLPGGLFAVRVLWPGLAIGLAVTQEPAPGLVSAAGGVVVALLAWHSSVKTAAHPPREAGSRFPIPAELTPREVLEAADLDERGNPRR